MFTIAVFIFHCPTLNCLLSQTSLEHINKQNILHMQKTKVILHSIMVEDINIGPAEALQYLMQYQQPFPNQSHLSCFNRLKKISINLRFISFNFTRPRKLMQLYNKKPNRDWLYQNISFHL